MESMRAPNPNKLKVGMPHHVPKADKNVSYNLESLAWTVFDPFYMQDYTEDEKKVIGELKQLYLETINLDVKMQREIYNMEKQYEQRHNEIFDKRKKILEFV